MPMSDALFSATRFYPFVLEHVTISFLAHSFVAWEFGCYECYLPLILDSVAHKQCAIRIVPSMETYTSTWTCQYNHLFQSSHHFVVR